LVNYDQKEKLFEKIHTHFDGNLKGKAIAIWGLSFKPGTDDMREAPSRVLMEALWKAGVLLQAYDPEAMGECQRIYGQRDDLTLMGTAEAVLKNVDALVTITKWQQFRAPDFDLIKQSLSSPVIFDGRNMYDPTRPAARGIEYYSIGP
jgi:UDPglucose 6-dehydrogenase